MHQLRLQLSPTDDIIVPNSDGYNVFSALLELLQNHDPSISARAHDSQKAEFHNSGLIGDFGSSNRRYHKTVRDDETYQLVIGVPSEDSELVDGFRTHFHDEGEFTVCDGTLTVTGIEEKSATHAELVNTATQTRDPDLRFNFQSPICLEEAERITTLFPHRVPVFTDLATKWNYTAPQEHQIDLTGEEVKENVVEKSKGHIPTYNVVVNQYEDDSGDTKNIFSHGFGGGVTYGFRDAPPSLKQDVATLALFAEYSGIGIATARGCGNVRITLE